MAAALSTEQIQQYRENGYIYGLPVFSPSELDEMNTGLDEILALLEPGESTKEIREWHEASRFLFDLCMHDRILDYVEPLIGPDFVMWASNFFIKQPRSPESVTWHQDAYYWPLEPRASCTVWLAFDDVDAGNGGMVALPGSHKHGILPHNRIKPDSSGDGKNASVLGLECDVSQFDLASSEIVTMKAGEISIHSDQLAHSSPGNPSDRRRAGLTIRYSPTNVKCDLTVNPHFRSYLARGTDVFAYNPKGAVPSATYGRLHRQHLSVEEAGEQAEQKVWGK
jgi:chlorinating enzyme